jgi:hypothetical protein
MRQFIQLCHEKDIDVLGEFALLLWPNLLEDHPDWLIVDLDDGRAEKPDPTNKSKSFFCIHSPFKEWISTLLTEYAEQFDVDGFWFDDTNFSTRTKWPWSIGCRCDYCKKKFRLETGLEIPDTVDWQSDTFKKFMIWRKDKLSDFFRDVAASVQEKRPGFPMIYNHYTLNYVNGETAHTFEPGRCNYHYFTEECCTPYLSAKIMAGEKRDYFEIWNWATEISPSVTHGMPPYPSPINSILIGMSIMANGGTPTLAGVTHDFKHLRAYFNTVFSEYKKRSQYRGGEPFKNCGIHFSARTRDFCYGDKPRSYRVSHQGIYEALNRSQIITDFIMDQSMNLDEISGYKIIYLPDSACLSDEQCEAIRAYVNQGGVVVATLNSSLFNEWGEKRTNFALADVFGVDYCSEDSSVFKPDTEDGTWSRIFAGRHGIMYLPKDEDLIKAFNDVIVLSGRNNIVSAREDAKVLCTLSNRTHMMHWYANMDHDSNQPSMVEHAYGQGYCYYLSSDLGASFMETPYPRIKELITYPVRKIGQEITVDAPSRIQVTAYKRENNQLFVHLVNYQIPLMPDGIDADIVRTYYAQQEIEPARMIKIMLHGKKAVRAYLPLSQVELPIADDQSVTIPEVMYHEVVVFEFNL